MTYKKDLEKWEADIQESRRLYNIWYTTKSEEDKDKYLKFTVSSKKYLTIQLKIWPADGIDADKIKEILENNGCSIPWIDENVYHGDEIIGEIIEAKVSCYPKKSL